MINKIKNYLAYCTILLDSVQQTPNCTIADANISGMALKRRFYGIRVITIA